ncbi:MAG: hypothetical protein R3E12_13425 [Candidatus Eisenbacteria bacterium]
MERASRTAARDSDACAGVLGTLALIPTSWLSYQCLLAMPLLVSVAWVRPSDRVSVVLLLGAITIGSVLYSYGVTFDRHPAAFSTFRTVLPYLLASVLARLSDSGPVTSPA